MRKILPQAYKAILRENFSQNAEFVRKGNFARLPDVCLCQDPNHGGHIIDNSRDDAGNKPISSQPVVGQTNEQELPGDDLISGKGKILVLDDEPIVLMLMEFSLPSLGYEVETVEDGEQAVQMYEKAAQTNVPFSLVIMDLFIPNGVGGPEAAQKILKNHPQALLLISSGDGNDPIMANPLQYGFQAAIHKPYDLKELSHLLHTLLQS